MVRLWRDGGYHSRSTRPTGATVLQSFVANSEMAHLKSIQRILWCLWEIDEVDGFEPGAVWPVESLEEIQIREVYARFGLAQYTAQVLEHGLVNALLILDLVPKGPSFMCGEEWVRAVDVFFDAEFAKTFGNLVKRIEGTGKISVSLIELLKVCKSDRDVLAHRFFRDKAIDFATKQGRKNMIIACEDMIEKFSSADKKLSDEVRPVREKYGISDARMQQEYEKMKKEIAARNAKN